MERISRSNGWKHWWPTQYARSTHKYRKQNYYQYSPQWYTKYTDNRRGSCTRVTRCACRCQLTKRWHTVAAGSIIFDWINEIVIRWCVVVMSQIFTDWLIQKLSYEWNFTFMCDIIVYCTFHPISVCRLIRFSCCYNSGLHECVQSLSY